MQKTRAEVITLLKTDPSFCVEFFLANNFRGVADKMESLTGVMPRSRDEAFADIMQMISQRNPMIYEILAVPYIDNVSNWTGGYGSVMPTLQATMPTSSTGNQQRSINWGNFFTGIGAVGTALGGVITSQSNQTPYDPYAAQRAEQERQRLAAEEEKRKNRAVIGTIVGVVAAIVLIIVIIGITGKKSAAKAA